MICFLLPWAPTEAARKLAADVRLALARADIPEKVAADVMGIPRSLLSEQLSAQKQLSASRLASLPANFHDELLQLRARRSGGLLLTADILALLRGAAALPKTMLKASLPSANRERKQA